MRKLEKGLKLFNLPSAMTLQLRYFKAWQRLGKSEININANLEKEFLCPVGVCSTKFCGIYESFELSNQQYNSSE